MRPSVVAFAIGALALVWFVLHTGAAEIGQDVLQAGWALLPMAGVHVAQLALSAAAWRIALDSPALGLAFMLRVRWVREGVNALLPVAQIGGQVAGIRLLTRHGVGTTLATAGTVMDLTLEAAGQFVFTLAGLGVLVALGAAPEARGWILGGVLLTGLGACGFVVAQRLGLLRLVEAGLARLAVTWPALASWSLAGLHDRLMRLQRNWRAMARAVALHSVSWALGGAEVWIALGALGQAVTPAQALVIESLGMVARSVGFVIPGAIGVQEGGFVLACGVFAIPQETALSLSILKRLREILVGAPALLFV